jgi:SAM-dependent methyltransferase
MRRIVNAVALPVRALFVREQSGVVLMSLHEERNLQVLKHCKRGTLLDLGCGPKNVFVRTYWPRDGFGADVFEYEGIDVLVNSLRLPFGDHTFDTVTLIAVGGHIPKSIRVETFGEIFRVLKNGGVLVLTEGEIITQTIHHKIQFFFDRFRKDKNPDTVRGMEEDEEFAMPHREIQRTLFDLFNNWTRYRFQLGLNNVYVARKN